MSVKRMPKDVFKLSSSVLVDNRCDNTLRKIKPIAKIDIKVRVSCKLAADFRTVVYES